MPVDQPSLGKHNSLTQCWAKCWPSGYCESMHAVIQEHSNARLNKLTFSLRRSDMEKTRTKYGEILNINVIILKGLLRLKS